MDKHHQSVLPNTTAVITSIPHVVIFPLPLQGPVNCMLKLAELILTQAQAQVQAQTQARAQPDVSITFINTDFIQRRLDRHSDTAARFARFCPRFRFEVVPDGLGPDENPRGGEQIADMTISLEAQAQTDSSRLREVLAYGSSIGPDRKPVTCIIADGLFAFMVDVGKEIGVPLVYFETVSPCGLWTYLCVPKMVQAGELPFQGDDLDAQISSVPGMEAYLRRRDLPTFCRSYDPNNKMIQLILKEAQYYARAQGHILNTFDDLEGPLLPHFRTLCANLYTIGPIHLHLKTRVRQGNPENATSSWSSSNSLWQEDRSCFAWLDAQPSRSVLFVSIGSLAVMTKHQLIEFSHGLVNSKTRFLWVRRPGSIIDVGEKESDLDVAMEVLEDTRERGCLVRWVPQEEVLAHRAIGGFLTHSGWNSTLESIVEGVPMICWPFFVDQQVNSRLVSEVWGVGLDMKDIYDRIVIEKMVKDLMGARRNKLATKVDEKARLAAQAVDEDGSSHHGLNRLVDDIRFMTFQIPSDANKF